MWLLSALASSFFAGLTAILAKCGIRKTDSDVATAIRTIVVVLFSWIMVGIVGSFDTISTLSAKSLLFLVLSGIATGASWICYFKALSMASVNKVVPIDKSSTLLTVGLAIVLFQENNHLLAKLLAMLLIGLGILMMIELKKPPFNQPQEKKHWMTYAILSAIFAALTSILAKIGIQGVESNLGTAIRTLVVLVMAWFIVLSKGKFKLVNKLDKKELFFICLSGMATGASWLCYYYAIQNGVVSVVVPIDKTSILFSVLFSFLFFKEKLSKRATLGLCIMITGTLIMTFFA